MSDCGVLKTGGKELGDWFVASDLHLIFGDGDLLLEIFW
jgi:hypothetical protein